jgi:hypothetical protein
MVHPTYFNGPAKSVIRPFYHNDCDDEHHHFDQQREDHFDCHSASANIFDLNKQSTDSSFQPFWTSFNISIF